MHGHDVGQNGVQASGMPNGTQGATKPRDENKGEPLTGLGLTQYPNNPNGFFPPQQKQLSQRSTCLCRIKTGILICIS